MKAVPLLDEVAELIGANAQRVENASLLLEKFCLHKDWPMKERFHDASRWSLLRVAEHGDSVLNAEAGKKRDQARKDDAKGDAKKAASALEQASVAADLGATRAFRKELAGTRRDHTCRLAQLVEAAYGPARSRIIPARLEGRLAINLADGLIQNAGIALDRLFGLPYLPGSAVKGVCRSQALGELRAADPSTQPQLLKRFVDVFGTADITWKGDLAHFRDMLPVAEPDQRGKVVFMAAHPWSSCHIVVDLTNVHYPEYYKTGRLEDLSKEKPNPNAFPCVEAGGEFVFILVSDEPDAAQLLESAAAWLQAALAGIGIGAKTAAGYGWFSFPQDLADQVQQAIRVAKPRQAVDPVASVTTEEEISDPVERAIRQFESMPDQQFADVCLDPSSLSIEEQQGLIKVLIEGARRDRFKKWGKSQKKTDTQRMESIRALAQTLGIILS